MLMHNPTHHTHISSLTLTPSHSFTKPVIDSLSTIGLQWSAYLNGVDKLMGEREHGGADWRRE